VTEVYVGQIMMTGFNFAPRGFAQCNGQLMAIQQNQALFALLGVAYGGNGTSNFQLPDLRGRTPAGAGASVDSAWQPSPYVIGTPAGTENVTLGLAEMPAHNHNFAATTGPTNIRAPGLGVDYFAQAGTDQVWGPSTGTLVPLASSTLSQTGNNLPHNNMQPYRVINFNIALTGIFPARN
jgi:microcystin-dependent protein